MLARSPALAQLGSLDAIAQAERAYAVAERVIAGVRPDQPRQPTPCSEWDVRALVNHIIGAHYYFTAALHGEQMDPHGAPPDFAAGNPSESFAAARQAMLDAWRAPGALDRVVVTLLGPMPATMLIRMHAMDNLVHGWDLARATGQDERLDPELATEILAMMRKVDPPRGNGAPFKAEQRAPAGASPEQQLVAYLGRTV